MQTERPDQLQSLTPLRGIAALWVVLFHYTGQYLPTLRDNSFSHLFDKGYLAVDFFFMLSGFVLTHVYWRVFMEPVRGSYWRFLIARVARLYPLHLFMLSLFLATALAIRAVEYATRGTYQELALQGARSLTALLANVFMLQGLKASELSWNYPAWSISIEFIAYLAFPFVLRRIWNAGRLSKIVLAVALIAAVIGFARLTHGDFDQWDGPLAILRCMPEFLIGSLLYVAFAGGTGLSLLKKDGVLAGLVVVFVWLVYRGTSDLLVILLLPMLILAAVANKGRAAALLNAAPLVWLGEISYSLYLVHNLVQFITTRLLAAAGHSRDDLPMSASLAIIVGMLLVSLLCAGRAYTSVEKAGRQRLRLMFGA